MSRIAKALFVFALLIDSVVAMAEVLNRNTPAIRIRLGSGGAVDTVIYQPGIPNDFLGVPGVVVDPTEVSTTAIGGGSGTFRVRIVTDLNLKAPLSSGPNGANSLTGDFTYDSSAPMVCTTTPTCGMTPIPFNKISWRVRDGDTHTTPTGFDGSANQPAQTQIDTDTRNSFNRTRHRNYFEYQYNNDVLLPAGTYQGQIFIEGVGTPQ